MILFLASVAAFLLMTLGFAQLLAWRKCDERDVWDEYWGNQ